MSFFHDVLSYVHINNGNDQAYKGHLHQHQCTALVLQITLSI